MKYSILLFLFLLSRAVLAVEVSDPSNDLVYQVKPGDTLGNIARTLLAQPDLWRSAAGYNRLPNPDLILPGQTLLFKQVWLKNQPGRLKVEAVTGMASANGQALKTGDELGVGAHMETLPGSALRLRLPDGSLVNMLESSQLQVDKLETKSGNMFTTLFRLVTGQIEAFKKKYPDGQSDLSIRSATATLGVRGTHFRMRSEGRMSYAEIEEGKVNFDAAKTPATISLRGGEGAVADGEHPAVTVQLLPAPDMSLLPSEFKTPYIQFALAEQTGSSGYIGELARNDEFSDQVMPVQSIGGQIKLSDLPNGPYWLRLRSVDQYGLQGMEAKTTFIVNVPERKFAVIKAYVTSNFVELRWVGRSESAGYQVQIADNQEFESPMLDVKSPDNWVEIPKPGSGQYYMRVRQLSSSGRTDGWDVPMSFEVP